MHWWKDNESTYRENLLTDFKVYIYIYTHTYTHIYIIYLYIYAIIFITHDIQNHISLRFKLRMNFILILALKLL